MSKCVVCEVRERGMMTVCNRIVIRIFKSYNQSEYISQCVSRVNDPTIPGRTTAARAKDARASIVRRRARPSCDRRRDTYDTKINPKKNHAVTTRLNDDDAPHGERESR